MTIENTASKTGDSRSVFEQAKDAATDYIEDIAQSLSDEFDLDGYLDGNEYRARNPKRDDRNAGSFTINIQNGVWNDFGDPNERGGDIVAYVAHIKNIGAFDAAEWVIDFVKKLNGGHLPKTGARRDRNEITPIIPVPDGTPFPYSYKPSKSWEYRDTEGRLVCMVTRIDHDNGNKVYMTYCWGQERSETTPRWFWKGFPNKGPYIYGAEKLAAKPDAFIVLVEGEKCADALNANLVNRNIIAVSSKGGANNAHNIDWSPLAGRDVTIWPDADAAGEGYAATAAKGLLAQGCEVGIIDAYKLAQTTEDGCERDVPQGWDAADAVLEWQDHTALLTLAFNNISPYIPDPDTDNSGDAATSGTTNPAPASTSQSSSMSDVFLDAVNTHSNAQRIYDALNDPVPMFIHGGRLKYIGEEELPPMPSMPNEPPKTRGALTSAFITVKQDWLRAQASKHVSFTARKEKKIVPVRTPSVELQEIIAAPNLFGIPVVHQLVEAPFLTACGEVISEKGYHANQSIYLSSRVDVSGLVPENPTREDALAALGHYQDGLFGEFPFVDEASRSAAVSMVLTFLMRNLMTNAPMHGATAPTAGTGKSFLQALATTIAFNRDLPVSSPGKTEEEFEKRLDAMMLAGHPVIALDNVNGILKGDKLCQILTQSEVNCRPLGGSEFVKIVNRTSVVANGNNIRLPDDMVRRSVLSSLDANTDKPEERVFKTDGGTLRAAVLRDRALWIARAFTIVRAYLQALKEDDAELISPLAGFEQWSAFVRSPLIWLGAADPIATQETIRSDDPERVRRAAIFSAFAELTRDPVHNVHKWMTVREALAPVWIPAPSMGPPHFDTHHRLMPQIDILIENVPMRPGQRPSLDVLSRSLGSYFRYNQNAVAGEKKLLKGGCDSNGVVRWHLADHKAKP
jgi:putative DNA primase/helicase